MQNRQKGKRRFLPIIMLVFLAVLCVSYGVWVNHVWRTNYAFHLNKTNKEMARYHEVSKHDTEVLVFYKNGCADCSQVEREVSYLRQKHKGSTYLFEVKNKQVKPYLARFDITETPTFIVTQSGKVMDRYSGTDDSRIQQIFKHQKELQNHEN